METFFNILLSGILLGGIYSLAGTYSRAVIDVFGLKASVSRVIVFVAATLWGRESVFGEDASA